MRYVCQVAVVAAIFSALLSSQSFGQELSITNYQFVSEQRISQTNSYVTYRADLVNTGPARTGVTATVTSLVPNIQTLPGQTNLHFAPVPAKTQVTSLDTFTILVDRSVTFGWAGLTWSFLAPIANAGPGQTVPVGTMVTLNGGGSSNPSGVGSLSFNWTFVSRPPGTSTKLLSSDTMTPTFMVDVPGNFILGLTVSNGSGSDTSTVTVSTSNSLPVANAGPNQTVKLNSLVTLNGSASSDVDGRPLTYSWILISLPTGSTATLMGANTVAPTFIADKPGQYVAKLIVNDGKGSSGPSLVTISTQNTPPVANAGPNQVVALGSVVQLNGSGSTDVDGDPLTYRWSFNGVAAGSTATLSNPAAVNPTFTADKPGSYMLQLIVNDGQADSMPSTVTISTNAIQAPTANAGPNQTVQHGTTVTLNGSGTDPQGLPITFQWSLMSKPPGSAAALSSAIIQKPTFLADLPGLYIAQLIVFNGYQPSPPSTVTITTTNTPPVANAGPPQSLAVGAIVTLDGTGSTDADNDPITFLWSFNTRPNGSNAVISAPTSKNPTFLADAAGTYVLQLIVNDGFAPSNPATVTIKAGVKSIALTPYPFNLATNSSGTLTVTLGSPAGTGGLLVALASSDQNVASLQPSVLVAENAVTATVTVSSHAVGSALILASGTGYSTGSTTVNVSIPSISVTLDASTIGIGVTIHGAVTLSAAVDQGIFVTLVGAPNGVVTLPSTVIVSGGGLSAPFTITGASVGTATITASAPNFTSGSATINVGKLGAIKLPPNVTVGPGLSAPFPVTLLTPAPVGGVTITLASSDTSKATIPPSVFISPGALTPAVQPQVTGVNFGSSTITASALGFDGDSQIVQVGATLSFTPPSLALGTGGSGNLTLTLSAPAPAGLTINLSSDNPGVASVPSSMPFPTGAFSLSIPVTGGTPGTATIHASALPSLADVTASVRVALFGDIVFPSIATVGLGQTAAFPVSLSTAAPAGGITITLISSDATKVSIAPSTVTVQTGQTVPSTQPQITGKSLGAATISATAPAYNPATQSVSVGGSLSLSPQSVTIATGGTQNLTLSLSAITPVALTVTLISDNTGVATTPASATIPGGSNATTITVTGVTPGSTAIHASAPGVTTADASITVQSGGQIGLPASVTVALGGSAPFAVSLPQASSFPVTIALSSDSPKVTVSPATITILPGQTSQALQPQVTGVSIGSANITASANGYVSSSSPVMVAATVGFSPQSVTVPGGVTQNVTLNLSAATPTALTIALSSSNTAAATVPASVTIPANSNSTTVPVTGILGGTAVIHASAAPNIPDATLNVTVSPAGIIVPPSTTVSLGASVPFAVSLPTPAVAQVTIALASNSSNVTISPSAVVIGAGATTPATQPQVTGVSVGTATITASAPGYASGAGSASVTASLSFAPPSASIVNGTSQTIALNLSANTPTPLNIALVSDNTAIATVQATVTIPANSNTTTVQIVGMGLGTTLIHATGPAGVSAASASVTVHSSDIILPANLIVGPGQQVSFPVQLAQPATDAVFLQLTSSDTSKVTLSTSTVIISAGQTQPNSVPKLNGIDFGSSTITAMATGLATASAIVQVGATLSFSPSPVTMLASSTQVVSVAISAFAPSSGITVNLSSSDTTVVTVPSSVFIPSGQSSIGLTLASSSKIGAATITATTSAPNVPPATLNVAVGNQGAISLPSTLSVGLGQTLDYPVTLSAPAPTNGVTVTLVASLTTVSFVPLPCNGTPCPPLPAGANTITVFIAGGQTSPQTQPQITGVAPGPLTVTATAPGYSSDTKPVLVVGSFVFSPNTLTINGAGTGSLSLVLSGPAMVPITATLTSSNPNVAIVPASQMFFWDGSRPTTLNITVTALASGTTVIRASSPNMADTTATVTVTGPLSITTTSLLNGAVGVAYSAPVAAAGGLTPYSWSATGLPNGLNINPTTGQITGTPTAAGVSTVVVTVTDSTNPTHLTASANLSLTVTTGLGVTTTSLVGGVVGTPYSAPVAAAGGTTPYSWSATGLPNGLNINPTTGQITGTPTAAGVSTVVVTVTDSTNPTHLTASANLSLTIVTPPSITTTSPLPGGVVGAAYSAPVAGTGGTTPYTWSATGLPNGLNINPTTGQITGTPTAGGTSTVVVTVTDSTNPTHLTATANFSLTVTTGLSVTTTSLLGGVVGTPYSSPVAAGGGTTPYSWSATGLPNGLNINPTTGQITGTPTVAGVSTVVVTVTDSTNPTHLTASANLSLTIVTPPSITTTSPLPGGVVGTAYSAPVAGIGGTTPYTWSATGLPNGLNINPTTGQITGTPTAAGTSTVVVTLTDATNPTHLTATANLSITIIGPPTITTTSLLGGVVGTPYSAPVAAAGGTTPYSWSATGLPNGLNINPTTGQITGTPTAAGTSTVVITVTDSSSPSHLTGTANLSLTIITPPSITTTSLPGGTALAPYSAPVAGAGGTTPYTWSATGLPGGLSINPSTGQITGTPSAAGTTTVVVTLTDSTTPTHLTASANLPLVIAPANPASISATSGSGQTALVGSPYAAQLQATVLNAASQAVSGASVVFTAPSSGPSVIFAGGGNSATVLTNSLGVATAPAMTANAVAGTFTVTAAVSGISPANFPLANVAASGPPITLTPTNVGKDLQTPTTVTLGAASTSDVVVTLTSSDPNTVLLGGVSRGSLTVTIPQGTTQTSVLVQGLAASGSATITASATGYLNGTGAVTLFPSGFVLAGPNDVGASFQTVPTVLTTMTVYPARLDSTAKYAEKQSLRVSFASTVTVNVTSSSAGTVTPGSVTFNAGDSNATTSFKAVATGAATITAQNPSGFTPVSDGSNTVTATITSQSMMPDSVTVGRNLQAKASIALSGSAGGSGLIITVSSDNPGKVQLSTTATGLGQNSISLNLLPGARVSPDFFIYGLDSTGTTTYSAQATGFGNGQGTVTLAPSGIAFANPFAGVETPILTTPTSGPTTVTVFSTRLNSTGDVVEIQPVAGGLSATVDITNSGTSSVGSVSPSTITIASAAVSASTSFNPGTVGSTSLAVSVPASPAGFSTPSAQFRALPVTVVTAGMSCTDTSRDGVLLGQNMQIQGSCSLGVTVPAGGVTVTMTSGSPSQLVLAATPTAAGQGSIQINVPAGSTSFTYYLQALGGSGNVSYTATASGYSTGSGTIGLNPSSIVLGDSNDLPFVTVATGGTKSINVRTARLNPSDNSYAELQQLRGGFSINVTLQTASGVATVDSPVTITGGAPLSAPVTTTLHGISAGNTTVTANQPTGFIASTNSPFQFNPTSTIPVTVN